MKTETALASASVTIAMEAAARFIARNNLKVDFGCLTENLKIQVKAKLPEALADAQAAIACRMTAVAEQTFAATIALAGVEAARRSVIAAN